MFDSALIIHYSCAFVRVPFESIFLSNSHTTLHKNINIYTYYLLFMFFLVSSFRSNFSPPNFFSLFHTHTDSHIHPFCLSLPLSLFHTLSLFIYVVFSYFVKLALALSRFFNFSSLHYVNFISLLYL